MTIAAEEEMADAIVTSSGITEIFGADQIETRVLELGREISRDYQDRPLTVVALLHGAMIFCADLIRHIQVPLLLDIVKVNSYCGQESTGHVTHLLGLSHPVEGRDVLLVDDILDSGLTLTRVSDRLRAEGAASLRTCVLLDKHSRHPADIAADYTGFPIDDVFVIGYGLDCEGYHRNLPFIGVLQ